MRNLSAKVKVGGKVPTNNAAQMVKDITKLSGSQAFSALPKSVQRQYSKAVRDLARSQQSTSKAAINATRDAAVSLGTTYGAMQSYSKSRDTEVAKAALGSGQSYDRALNQWNGIINQTPEDPYVAGSEGETSGSATTGSILGG